MKRIRLLSLILATLLLLGALAACGEHDPSGPPQNYNHANPTLQKINDLNSDVSFRVENRLEENDWTDPAQNNVSTFSADVDTASYTMFRRLVNSGITMAEMLEEYAGWFRTEEMVNYFRYNYAEPTGADDLFGVTESVFTCPWDNGKALLVLGFAADSTVPETAGNNYVFLIDVSGSMSSADKLPLLKKSLTKLANTLGPDDLVSIVTYASREAVVCEGCSAGEKDNILNAIDLLRASGSTNGEKGLQMAYETAQKYFIEGGNNRIILCSDGDLNVGISDPEELKSFISEKKETGVYPHGLIRMFFENGFGVVLKRATPFPFDMALRILFVCVLFHLFL